jgi:hypothetical protein
MPAIPQIPSRPTLCACTRIPRPSQVSPPPADVPPPGQGLTAYGRHPAGRRSQRRSMRVGLGADAPRDVIDTLRLLHPQEKPTVRRRRPDAADLERWGRSPRCHGYFPIVAAAAVRPVLLLSPNSERGGGGPGRPPIPGGAATLHRHRLDSARRRPAPLPATSAAETAAPRRSNWAPTATCER